MPADFCRNTVKGNRRTLDDDYKKNLKVVEYVDFECTNLDQNIRYLFSRH
jgi:hypothetical protein